jgi:hypothetical protein
MKSKVILSFFLLFVSLSSFAQMGLNFQGVARNSSNAILANQQVNLRLSILQGSSTGTAEYTETRKVTTNAQGLFNVVIGDANASTSTGDFSAISWKNNPKFLKIEMDPAGGTSFTLLGTTQFQYVAYAHFANSVDAANISGIVPLEKGGTGVSSLNALKTSLAIESSLANKVDKITGKALSTNDYTTAEKTKLEGISGKNTGDQDLSGYATTSALALKINKTKVDSSLVLKATISKVDSGLALKVDKITGKGLSSNDYTTAEKTKLAGITGTNTGDQDLSGYVTTSALALKVNKTKLDSSLVLKATISKVDSGLALKVDKITGKGLSSNDYTTAEKTKLEGITGTNTGDQDLSGLATNTALGLKANALDVSAGLALKENVSNKSIATDLGGLSPSDELYPSQKAVKAYITANSSSGGIADGGISTIKLADLAVTDAKLATGISKAKVGLGDVENTALSTWNGSNNLTTVGTITSGTWSGTTIAISNGGTGATNAAAARSKLGLVIGTDVQAPLMAGTDYITPTGSASGLTNFPILNQNTTGNAATATSATTANTAITAGNITATSNSTLTSLPNLTSVGIISSGTWSGTVIDVAHGGTGTSTVTANTLFAGPIGSSGAPSFRALNITDIPDLSSKYILNNTYPWQMQSGDVTTTGSAIFGKDITVAGQRIGIGDANQDRLNLLFGKKSLEYYINNPDNSSGTMNTAIGPYSQLSTEQGNKNTSLGAFSLSSGEWTGDNNTAIGAFAYSQNNLAENKSYTLLNSSGSKNNTSLGAYALSFQEPTLTRSYDEAMNENTAIGAYALSGFVIDIDDSKNNTAIGYKAGSNLQVGSNNIFIGNNSQPISTTVSNQIVIGNASNTSSYIYGDLTTSALTTSGRISKMVTVTSNYTILPSDEIISANSTTAINVYLPSAVGIAGRTYTIKNINTGSVTVRPYFQLIDASSTYELTNRYSFVKLVSNGTIWLVIGLDNVSYSVSGGLTLTDLISSNVKAKTFELTQPSSINSTSTTTLDLSTGNVLQVVLTGSTTLAFTNPKIGTYIIKIKQDGSGNRTLNFPTIKWADAAVPTVTPTANAVDLITIIYDGVDYYGSCLQNF